MERRLGLFFSSLALLSGCASRSAGPGAPAELAAPPVPGDPVVTLLEPGAEPRAPLRYRVRAGEKVGLLLDMDMGMKITIGGQSAPAVKTPPARMTMAIETLDVAPDGTTRLVSKLNAVDVLARPDDRPEVVASVKQSMAGLVGLTTEMSLTSRGFARDVKVNVPAGLRPEMQTTLRAMRNATQQAAAIFPLEPVGVGARWRVESTIDTGQLKLGQTAVVTLDRREANRVFLTMTIAQTAPPQPINSPDLPAGTSVSLERYAGTGEGQMNLQLDSRTLNGRISLNVDVVTAVVQNENRGNIGVGMDMLMTFSPGPAP